MAENRIDLFNDMAGDIKHLVDGENRVDDVVLHTSPTRSGITVALATIAGGGDDDFSSSVSVALSYENDSFYASLAVDDNVKDRDVVRFVTQYFVGNLSLGVLWQSSENNQLAAADQEDGIFGSIAYRWNNFTWKLQYGESDQKAIGKEQLTAGFDYKLGDNTRLFTYVTQFDGDDDAEEVDHYGIGFEHRF